MPTYARCPECNASVPPAADWCSLCHTDLRPAPEPAPAFATAAHAGQLSAEQLSAEPLSAGPLPPVRGRHRAADHRAADHRAADHRAADHRAPDASGDDLRVPAGGRHAAGATARVGAGPALREEVDALVADAPVDADGKPDLEVLTDQLMARLATSERHGSRLPDLDSVPGGKWGVLVGGMLAVAVVLVVLSAVVGAVFLR